MNDKEDKHSNIYLKQQETKVVFKPDTTKHFEIIMQAESHQNNSLHDTHVRELFNFLAKKGSADFNVKDSKGWSPMQRAIATGQVEIMKLLICKAEGSCLKHTDLLTYAISKENLEIVKELIKSGADIDKEDDDGWTPLAMAIDKGNQEIMTLLTKNGANPNSVDSKKRAPITMAIEKGNQRERKMIANPVVFKRIGVIRNWWRKVKFEMLKCSKVVDIARKRQKKGLKW